MSEKFEIEAEFNNTDLETIMDAMDEWESKDVGLLDLIEKLKCIPEPPKEDNPEFHESFVAFKNHMISQEKKAKDEKKLRREKAVLLKAKIVLMTQRRAAERLADDAASEVAKSGFRKPNPQKD